MTDRAAPSEAQMRCLDCGEPWTGSATTAIPTGGWPCEKCGSQNIGGSVTFVRTPSEAEALVERLRQPTQKAHEYIARRGHRWYSSTRVRAIAPFKNIPPSEWLAALDLIASLRTEVERLTKERDGARADRDRMAVALTAKEGYRSV